MKNTFIKISPELALKVEGFFTKISQKAGSGFVGNQGTWPFNAADLAYEISGNSDFEKFQNAVEADEGVISALGAEMRRILDDEAPSHEGVPFQLEEDRIIYLWLEDAERYPKEGASYNLVTYALLASEDNVRPARGTGATLALCRMNRPHR